MRKWVLVLVGIGTVGFVMAAVSTTPRQGVVTPKRPVVRVAPAGETPESVEQSFSGRVSSPSESALSFTVSGRVVEIAVDAGKELRQGDLIARLDDQAWRLTAEQSEAALSRVDVQLEQARRDLDRARALGTAVTQEEMEHRLTSVAGLEAERRRVVAGLSEARRLVREAVLRAPYSGVVTDRFVELDEVVQSGRPVVQLSGSSSRMEIDILVPESVLAYVSVGDEVRVEFPLSEVADHAARIARISTHASSRGGLFPVTLSVQNGAWGTQTRLPPGAQARVYLPEPLARQTVLLPPGALVTSPSTRSVVYLVEDDAVRATGVVVQRLLPDGAVVTGNVEPGDSVVVSGHFALSDGQTVEVGK